jgi:hypothetical protein
MDIKETIYDSESFKIAFNDFVINNEKSIPFMMDAIGKKGVYTIFASGYLACITNMQDELNSILNNENDLL